MKILFVSNLYGALARGGAERVVAAEATALHAAGHEVTVVSGVPDAATAAAATLPDGVRHITYVPPNLCFYTDLAKHGPAYRLWWHYWDTLNQGSATRLAEIVCAEKPDVVHTHNLMGLGFMIPLMLRRLRVRHIHTVHDVQLLDPSGLLPADREFRPAAHQALYISVMQRLMGSPETVVFPSEFHLRLHERFGFFPKSRRVVVRNPVARGAAPTADTEEHGAVGGTGAGTGSSSERRTRFLFAGQLEKHKGVLDLLDAWSEAVLAEGATLEIAGGGTLAITVAERVAQMRGVKMLGRLDGAALDVAYARAGWLVLPSRVIENAPASIAEASAYGVPTIASASGGIPEVVRDGEDGMLFPPGSVKLLAKALAAAARMDATEYARYRDAARAELAAQSPGAVAAADSGSDGNDVQAHAKRLLEIYAKK